MPGNYRALSETVRAAQEKVTVEKYRLILSIVLYIFSLWQLEVSLIFNTIAWPTDILWIKFPVWVVVTFYMGVLSFAWLLKPIKRIYLIVFQAPSDQ